MRRRNPRRAYDAEGREIPPPTVGHYRSQGDRTAAVRCQAIDCGHQAVISTDRFPAELPFPDIELRLRCSRCGSRTISVMCDMLGLYARHYSETGWSMGTAGQLPPDYRVVGRDLPWPAHRPEDQEP
ncbi:hypothetical protein [Methylobacterium sp. JK268]